MNLTFLKARWVKWAGLAFAMALVAALAAGTTYWFSQTRRSPERSPFQRGRINRSEFGQLRHSLDQLRQLQAEMDRLFEEDWNALSPEHHSHLTPPEVMNARMEQLVQQMGLSAPAFDPAGAFDEGWNLLHISPAINMHPEKDRVVVTVTLPHTDKKDIRLTISGDILKISAQRSAESKAGAGPARSTRQTASFFEQQIRLPAAPADPAAVEATFNGELLTVIVPLPGLTPPGETPVPIR